VQADVIKLDVRRDLALLRPVSIPSRRPLDISTEDTIDVGTDVVAIGHPTGEAWTFTKGIVSAFRPDYEWTGGPNDSKHIATVIQTQTPINPGNSGGPLLTEDGKIVGVNAFGTKGTEGINFAIAAKEILAFLANIRLPSPTDPSCNREAPTNGGRHGSVRSAPKRSGGGRDGASSPWRCQLCPYQSEWLQPHHIMLTRGSTMRMLLPITFARDDQVINFLLSYQSQLDYSTQVNRQLDLLARNLARIDRLGDDPRVVLVRVLYAIALFVNARYREAAAMQREASPMADRLGDAGSKAWTLATEILVTSIVEPKPLNEFEMLKAEAIKAASNMAEAIIQRAAGNYVFSDDAYLDEPQRRAIAAFARRWTWFVIGVEEVFRGRMNEARDAARELLKVGQLLSDPRSTGVMSRCLLNIAKRSLLRLMLSCVGLASKHVAG
jgi:Trypsin-like peptidase domain